jgi:hypothetical protein
VVPQVGSADTLWGIQQAGLDRGRPKEGRRREGEFDMRKFVYLPRAKSRATLRPWPTRRTVSLLSGLATLAMLMVNVPTSARAEPHQHTVSALLVSYAPAAATALPDRLSPPTDTAAERLVAPMIELGQPRPRRTPSGIQLASLGGSEIGSSKRVRSSLSGGTIRWGASPSCLNSTLRTIINEVASIFGPVKVNSTCRSRTHNAKVGGATHSKHLTGDAADFSVRSNKRGVLAYLQKNPSVGGLKLYGGDGHFHIDTGPRRTW